MFKRNYLFFIIAIALLAHAQSRSQETATPRKTGLSIAIIADLSCYSTDGHIKMTVRLKNRSDIPIYLYRYKNADRIPGLGLSIYDETKGLTGSRDPIAFVFPPKPERGDFVKIEKQSSLEERISFAPKEKGINRTGSYAVTAFYQSPVFENQVPLELRTMRTIVFEDSNIYSASIPLKINSRCGLHR